MQNTYVQVFSLQLLCQMTLAKISSITHQQQFYLPSDACSLDGKLRVKCTSVAQTQCDFLLISDTALFNLKFSYRK